jgi:hypothetical protein
MPKAESRSFLWRSGNRWGSKCHACDIFFRSASVRIKGAEKGTKNPVRGGARFLLTPSRMRAHLI